MDEGYCTIIYDCWHSYHHHYVCYTFHCSRRQQSTGIPLHLNKKIFKVFIVSDAVYLFASSTSVLISVGILTSRYSKDDFLTSFAQEIDYGTFCPFHFYCDNDGSFLLRNYYHAKGSVRDNHSNRFASNHSSLSLRVVAISTSCSDFFLNLWTWDLRQENKEMALI
ncbi:hypothetical protein REPUB_Repub03eG0179100 [Reevesia pubescens]